MDVLLILLFGSNAWLNIAATVLYIFGLWFLLKKSGLPGWWALVPFAREYMLSKCAGREAEGRVTTVVSFLIAAVRVSLKFIQPSGAGLDTASGVAMSLLVLELMLELILLVYSIRVYAGLIEVYGVRRRWLWLWVLLAGLPATIWGLSGKYQPLWKVEDIRKELASMQRKLSETVSEKEFAEMQAAAQAQKEDLTKELSEAKAEAADIQAKLDKAKEDLKKQKAKQKDLEAARDEEVKKAIEGKTAEIEEQAAARARESSQELLDRTQRQVGDLQEYIEKLEAEKAKLSNTSLMEFKVYVDQLQDIYFKICDIITEENQRDEATGAKMQTALQKIVEGWRP